MWFLLNKVIFTKDNLKKCNCRAILNVAFVIMMRQFIIYFLLALLKKIVAHYIHDFQYPCACKYN
jgi:hypothetical protein